MQGPDHDDELFEHYRIKVDAGQSLIRIDKFLSDKIANISRNKIQEALRQGFVFVNGQTVKPNHRLHPADEISVNMPEPPREFELIPQDIPLNVVYEDEAILIINKPAGMVVHPGVGNWDGTLVNALAYRYKNLPSSTTGEEKLGLVHRIDKDTSGLLVIAKTDEALTKLAKQFADHSIEREYYALVWGEIKEDEGTVEGHIGRHPKDRKMYTVFPEGDYGKEAITHYKVLKRLRYVTLVACRLETGRTHQIRVHMKYIGHTLFGDTMYGGDAILKGERFTKYKQFVENCFALLPRQALHARLIGFVHPITGQNMRFEAELPDDMNAVIEKWEHYVQWV